MNSLPMLLAEVLSSIDQLGGASLTSLIRKKVVPEKKGLPAVVATSNTQNLKQALEVELNNRFERMQPREQIAYAEELLVDVDGQLARFRDERLRQAQLSHRLFVASSVVTGALTLGAALATGGVGGFVGVVPGGATAHFYRKNKSDTERIDDIEREQIKLGKARKAIEYAKHIDNVHLRDETISRILLEIMSSMSSARA